MPCTQYDHWEAASQDVRVLSRRRQGESTGEDYCPDLGSSCVASSPSARPNNAKATAAGPNFFSSNLFIQAPRHQADVLSRTATLGQTANRTFMGFVLFQGLVARTVGYHGTVQAIHQAPFLLKCDLALIGEPLVGRRHRSCLFKGCFKCLRRPAGVPLTRLL